MNDIDIRNYSPDTDKGFLYSTWLKGLHYGNSYFGSIDKDIFFDKYEGVLNHILSQPDTLVLVATLDGDEDMILGYVVVQGDVIHWAHTKAPWRKQGIAKRLLAAHYMKPTTVTHVTPAGNAIRLKLGLTHNPWRI